MPCEPWCARVTLATRPASRATNATRAPRPSHSPSRANPRPDVPPVIATRSPSNRSMGVNFVESSDEQPGAVGRPAKQWRLTREADRLFPDAYAELSVALLD